VESLGDVKVMKKAIDAKKGPDLDLIPIISSFSKSELLEKDLNYPTPVCPIKKF
jgi:hypothetical protein